MRLIQLIRDTEDLPPTDKCLLYTLAAYGQNDGSHIWPGLDLLAKKMKISERTIRRSLKHLIDKKYIAEDGWRGHIKKYNIPMHDIWSEAQIAPNKGKPKKVKLVPPDEDISEEDTQEVPAYHENETPEEKKERRRRESERAEELVRLHNRPAYQRTPADIERLRKAGFTV